MKKHLFMRSSLYYGVSICVFLLSSLLFAAIDDSLLNNNNLTPLESVVPDDDSVKKINENHYEYKMEQSSERLSLKFYDLDQSGKIDTKTQAKGSGYDADLVERAYSYYVEGLKLLKERKETIDDDELYAEKLKFGAMSFPVSIDGVSHTVKFFLVSGKIVGRVLVEKKFEGNKRELSYCFFAQDDSLDPKIQTARLNEKNQFLSRQRAQEKRDVVEIQLGGISGDPMNLDDPSQTANVISSAYSHYAPWYTVRGIKDWYDSVKAPANVLLGGVCAVWQVGVVGCLGVADSYLNGGASSFSQALHDGLSSAQFGMILSGIYGSVLGIWAGTYKNICYTGKYINRVIKSSLASIVYGYLIVINKSGFSVLSPLMISGILLNLHVIVNTILGKTVLDEYYRILRYKTFRGDFNSRGTMKIAGINTGVEYSNFLFQSIYNFLVFPMKFADLTRMGFTLPGGKFIGLGKIIYYLSGPVVVSYNLKWFRREYVNLVNLMKDDNNEQSAIAVENKKLLKKLQLQYDQVEKVWQTIHSLWMAASWEIALPTINLYRALYLDSKLDQLKSQYEQTGDPNIYVKMRRASTFIQASARVSEAVKNVFVYPVVKAANKVRSVLFNKKQCVELFSKNDF